jgi:diaminopimelate decarboxylase
MSRLALFPLDTSVNNQGHVTVGGCDTVELVAEYGTPLYLFDEFTLRSKCREFKKEFGQRYTDSIVIYASKAFLNKAIADILQEEGVGLDVVSSGELGIAESAAFPMDMIYFHGSNKTVEEIKLALKNHVSRIVVDNADELDILTKIAEESGHIADILLRLTPGINPQTHEHITTGAIGSKFGFPIFEAAAAVSQAMYAPSLNLIGFHFHLGSLIKNVQPYMEAIEIVFDFVDEVKRNFGFELEELNIGGGFAIQYTIDSPVPPVSYYAEAIVSRVVNKCHQLKLPHPMLVIEPGRAVTGQAGIALYRVGTTKDIPSIRRYISVDGGMGDNIRPALYGARYEALVANKALESNSEHVTIAGKFCESGDMLVKDISLPPVLRGDIIAIPDCGAYCLPMGSNYNASLRPAVILVNSGKARLIRRRETFDDMTRCDLK